MITTVRCVFRCDSLFRRPFWSKVTFRDEHRYFTCHESREVEGLVKVKVEVEVPAFTAFRRVE